MNIRVTYALEKRLSGARCFWSCARRGLRQLIMLSHERANAMGPFQTFAVVVSTGGMRGGCVADAAERTAPRALDGE